MSHDPQTETAFATYGDLGDIIYLCPSMSLVSAREGAPVTLFAKDGLRPGDPITARIPVIAPLLESQPYIKAVLPYAGEPVTHDACFFRDDGLPFGETLATRQAQWLKLDPDLTQPWLYVTLEPYTSGCIVINRSARYHNHFFPWRELVETFGSKMVFIGTPGEHVDFCRFFGHVGYFPTKSLLEAAQAIAGSELFIGNQSSCNAIAEGLKHRLIQETDLNSPDCIYPRRDAIHCHNGELDFHACGQHFASKNRLYVRAHINESPPGGWSVTVGEHHANSYAFELTISQITEKLQRAGISIPQNLREMMIEQNSTEHLDHPVSRLKAQLYTI
jgi:hypothetical protein